MWSLCLLLLPPSLSLSLPLQSDLLPHITRLPTKSSTPCSVAMPTQLNDSASDAATGGKHRNKLTLTHFNQFVYIVEKSITSNTSGCIYKSTHFMCNTALCMHVCTCKEISTRGCIYICWKLLSNRMYCRGVHMLVCCCLATKVFLG